MTTMKNIIKIIYEKGVKDLLSETFKIQQIQFPTIKEYYDIIYKRISLYSACFEISKSEFSRHFTECFYNGLGRNSTFEVVKKEYRMMLKKPMII